jgi:hypothetical protein
MDPDGTGIRSRRRLRDILGEQLACQAIEMGLLGALGCQGLQCAEIERYAGEIAAGEFLDPGLLEELIPGALPLGQGRFTFGRVPAPPGGLSIGL